MNPYLRLIRFDKPIGTLLLLYPTLWALMIAAQIQSPNSWPDIKLLIVFSLGTFLMRSAGCVINDFADRHIDGKVKRTNERPLVSGEISKKQALIFFFMLLGLAFCLVLTLNSLTIWLSFAAAALAALYPFTKRHLAYPQFFLGLAFAMSVPMAFAATLNNIPPIAWLVFLAVVLWTISYDTFYAMVDYDDDLHLNIGSTALWWGKHTIKVIALLQMAFLICMSAVGIWLTFGALYFVSLAAALGCFSYQLWLAKEWERARCFEAFLHNRWVGVVILLGCVLTAAKPG